MLDEADASAQHAMTARAVDHIRGAHQRGPRTNAADAVAVSVDVDDRLVIAVNPSPLRDRMREKRVVEPCSIDMMPDPRAVTISTERREGTVAPDAAIRAATRSWNGPLGGKLVKE